MNRLVIALMLVLCPYYVSYGQDYVSLQDKQGRSFLVEVDPATGAASRVLNPSVNLDDYGIDHRHLNSQAIDRVTHQLLDDFNPILKLDASQVQMQRADTDGTMWFVSYRQVHRGVPVAWTEIGYTINSHGEVITLGGRSYPNVEVITTPTLSSATAISTAREIFNEDHVEVRDDAKLIIAPRWGGRCSIPFNVEGGVVLLPPAALRELLCRCTQRRHSAHLQQRTRVSCTRGYEFGG